LYDDDPREPLDAIEDERLRLIFTCCHLALAIETRVARTLRNRLEDKLAGYHVYHATRADLLRRLGRSQKSRAAYDKAIELVGNAAEIAYLTRRRDQLGQRPRIPLLG
jgi:predicted RNA polymerase sigma factor